MKKYGTWHSNMQFPYLNDTIFIDIETDLDMKHVWLIGLKFDQTETQFLAWNFREEYDLLEDFGYFLSKYPNKPLVCYSTTNFDFRILQSAARRLGLNWVVDQMNNRALVDLGTLLRRHFTPYGNKYSLKLLRFLIGYKYDDDSIDGEEVAIRYYREVRKRGRISKEFAEKAKKYNLDDIRILYYMIDLFKENIEFTNNYTKSNNLSEIKHLLETETYSSNFSSSFIRISIDNERATEVMQHLMCHGLPLPQVSQGVNITALYWRSRFSYQRAKNLFKELNLF